MVLEAAGKDSGDQSTPLASLGMDSLDFVSLFLEIEKEFGVSFPLGKVGTFDTIGHLASFVGAHANLPSRTV